MSSNYHTPTTPQTGNFRRVTTDAYFTPDVADGKTGDLRLGSITMSGLKHGNSEVEVMFAYKGGLQRAAYETSEVRPEYEITLNEYIPNLVAVYLFGTVGTDAAQAAATALTAAFPSVNTGRAYRLGKLWVSNVVVTVAAAVKVVDVDYQLDVDKGIIVVMDGGSIADGAALSVTFDCAGVTRKVLQPYTRLNRPGFLRIYEEDTQGKTPRSESYFRCNLTPTQYGDGDPKKFSESKFKCSVLGAMQTYLR